MLATLSLFLLAQATGTEALPAPLLSRTNLSAREGVPASSIRDLCYDADGFLVLATTGGLSRYDGHAFQHFLAAETPGLNGDRILTLLTDSKDRTWIGGRFGGPSVYRSGQFQSVADASVLTFVRQIFEDARGTIWFVGDRLGQYRGDELSVTGRLDGIESPELTRVAEDSHQRLWLATMQGIFCQTEAGFERVDERAALWLLSDFQGDIWAQTEEGWLVKCSGAPEAPIDLGDAEINDELDRGSTRRLLATSRGLASLKPRRLDGSGLRVNFIELPGDGSGSPRVINAILEGQGQDLWAGTALYGLDYLERQYVRLLRVEVAKGAPNLFQVHPVDGNRALVERPGSIKSCLVDSVGALMPLTSEAGWDERAFDTAVTEAGVWVACIDGLARLEGRRLIPVERWRGKAGALATDGAGAVWMLDKDRVCCVVPGRHRDSCKEGDFILAEGAALIESYRGEVVGVIDDRLVRLDVESMGWVPIAQIRSKRVRALREGAQDDLWVSTYGDGLFRLNADGSLDHWDRDEGLPDPFLGWISPIDDNGNLWLSSNTGIQMISVSSLDAVADGSEEDIHARTFRAPECNGAAGARLSDSVFALPTLEGLVLFDSRAVPPPSAAPRVSISAPALDGKAGPGELALDPETDLAGSADLRFEFHAPVFPTAADAKLQTKLIGLESHWVDAGNSRMVRYPGVRAGTYTLAVRARTPTTSWSAPVLSETVVIAPYWYDRGWARALMLGIMCLGVWSLVRLRTRALASRNRGLSFEIEQRELAEAHLRTSEERFRRLFHTAPSAIVSWSPEGELLDFNSQAAQLFPRMGGPQSQKPEDHLVDPALGRAAFDRVLSEGGPVSLLALTHADSDEPKRCRWHLAPTIGDDGLVINVIAVVMDLSRQERDARTVAKLRESLVRAEESERSRIARELHDDLSQRLAALALSAHLIDQGVQDGAGSDSRLNHSLRSEIESIATDVHSLSRQLHPTIVDDLGLRAALKSECSQRHQLSDIKIGLSIGKAVDDPPREIALALFRIAQEALRNAAKHAAAIEIAVRLRVEGGELTLEVIDDGKGMTLGDAGGGIGMKSMRERAQLVGGDLEIQSAPGDGTSVLARVPIQGEDTSRVMSSGCSE